MEQKNIGRTFLEFEMEDEEEVRVPLTGKAGRRADGTRRKYAAIVVVGILTCLYSVVEVGFALYVDSMALLSDGVHNASDVISLVIAFWALYKSNNENKSVSMTYGWRRTEILGAVMNGCFLISLCVYIVLEAIPKIIKNPARLDSSWYFIGVSASGFVINTIGTILFSLISGGHGHVHAGGDHGHGHGNQKKKDKHEESGIFLGEHGHGHGKNNKHEDKDHDHGKKKKEKHDHDEHDHDEHDHGEHGHGHGHGKKKKEKHEHEEHDHGEHGHGHGHGKKKKEKSTEIGDEIENIKNDSHDHKKPHADHVDGHSHQQEKQKHGHEQAQFSREILINEAESRHGEDSHEEILHVEHKDHNMYAVFLHYLGDAFSSLLVLAAGLLSKYFPHDKWTLYLDPVCSLLIVLLILWTTIPLIIDCSRILLQKAPSHVNIPKLKEKLRAIPGVRGVHDLHVWELIDSLYIASAHILIEDNTESNSKGILTKIKNVMHKSGIHSSTLQMEQLENTSKDRNCKQFCVEECSEDWCCKDSEGMEKMAVQHFE